MSIGDAVGVPKVLVKSAAKFIGEARDFTPTLERNKETLDAVTPLVEEIKELNDELDRPREEVRRLEREVEAGNELVKKCTKFRWWRFPFLPLYRDKLQKQDGKVARFLSVDAQAQMLRDGKETLCRVRVIENHGQRPLLRGLSGAPEKPEFTVGFDEHLRKLKIELLKDGPVCILLVAGLGGSGKTTLAKTLCWDDQVTGKYGGSIFFVTVSKTPNLMTIVQTLFEHRGHRVSGFQSDEDAINRLELFLRQDVAVQGNPILLVLDDVRPGSEALVKKFKFQIPNYKILVTSRVAFPRFRNPYRLKPLDHDDAVALFRHFAELETTSSYMPDEDCIQEIVRGCKGSSLALHVIGGALCNQPFEAWEIMKKGLKNQSILKSNNDLLSRLQTSLDILEGESSNKEKECFMDLGLFLENQRIAVPSLIDMWAELYELDEDGKEAMNIIHNLQNKNLVNVFRRRNAALDTDLNYNNHFLTQHDLLTELAIHQSSQESFEQRERLIIDLSGNNHPEWWVGQNQQGIISRLLSLFFSTRWMERRQSQVVARTLSISTDEAFTSNWCNIQPDKAEVLILNIRSSNYTLPEFIDQMSKLKVLIVANQGFHHSELNNFELLGSLYHLKRIRLEKVSVPGLCKLRSLRKLSLYMCNIREAFGSSSVQISDALPNLVEMNIDYCNDLVELPSGLCEISTLKKLSITNCHKLSALPRDIGKLENLELLRLSSCSDLLEIPESVGSLGELQCLNFSDCVSLTHIPDEIGDLLNLKKLYMFGCSRLSELPTSVMNLGELNHLIDVICDEESAALWEYFPNLPNLKIKILKADISLNWLSGCRVID